MPPRASRGLGARRAFPWLLACLTLSGASGLIYEVSWVRSLELVFGATTFAVATVLAAFMGGLAAGSWLMASLAPRLERFHPLRIYGVIEALLGGAALLVPVALRLQVPLFQTIGSRLDGSFAALSLVRFAFCAAILIVPTALMGATLPVASRVASAAGTGAGQRVGVIYAFNTLGAVLGCAAAGLVLLPAVGLLRTQVLAVLLNALAAAGAFALAGSAAGRRARVIGVRRPEAAAPGAEGAGGDSQSAAGSGAAGRRLLIALYAVSGLTAMIYEVAWSRLLVLVLGSSTYSYTIMLTTFLLGLALGAWLGVRLLRRVPDAALAAGLCQIMIAVTTFLGLFLAGELPYLYHLVHDWLNPSALGLLGVQLLLAASLMILPTLGLGAMFPVIIGGLRPEGLGAPRAVGRAYAWNTLGAILGSVGAGFCLIPWLGSRGALLSGILVNTLLAIAAVLGARSRPARRYLRPLVATMLLFGANLFVGAPRWRPEILSSGIFRYVDRYRGMDRETFARTARRSHGEILMFREGLTCTVTVFRTTSALSLLVNGKPDASVPPGLIEPSARIRTARLGDLPTQILVGQIPLLLAPGAERVMVIGLGSGVTLGSVLSHPVKEVDCIELEDAVVRGSRFFDDVSGAPLRDPRVRMVVNDGRNQLLVGRREYDVIISEPSNPWIAGAASLFTREFFEVAKQRLRPGGLFCQWIQLYELRADDLRAMLRAFTAAFPEAHVFRVGSDAVVVGSDGGRPIHLERLMGLGGATVRADLERVGIRTPEDLLAHYWIGGRDLLEGLPSGAVNTDDNMLIEFTAPLRMLSRELREQQAQAKETAEMFLGRTNGVLPHLALPQGDRRAAAFLAGLAEAALTQERDEDALRYALRSGAIVPNPAATRVQGEVMARAGRPDEARDRLVRAAREFPRDPGVLRSLALLRERDGDWEEVRRLAKALLALAPEDRTGLYLLGESRYHHGDLRGALAALRPLGDADDSTPDLGYLRGASYAGLGRSRDAIPPLMAHLADRSSDREARALLARMLERAGRAEEALAERRRLDPEAKRQAGDRLRDGIAAWDGGRIDEARKLLEEGRQFDPDSEAIAVALARARARAGERPRALDLLERSLASHPDFPWATGYMSQLSGDAGSADLSRRLAARYVALTGESWEPIEDNPPR